MPRERRSFALQKAVNRNAKGRLLEAKRRPLGNPLTVNGLQRGVISRCQPLQDTRLFVRR